MCVYGKFTAMPTVLDNITIGVLGYLLDLHYCGRNTEKWFLQVKYSMFAAGQGKVRKKIIFSSSGNCQGISKVVREIWNFENCQGELSFVREK